MVSFEPGSSSYSYWDFTVPEDYSYVRAAADAGFTTFRYDRLGTGLSEKPQDAYKFVVFTHTLHFASDAS